MIDQEPGTVENHTSGHSAQSSPRDCEDVLRAAVAGVEQEVAQLKDLFVRRLLDDRQKAGLIEGLNQELKTAHAVIDQRFLEPILQEVLTALDRLISVADDSGHHQSIADEILEVFYRRGLEQIDTTGELDPRLHHVVAQITAEETRLGAGVLIEARKGYVLGTRTIRPAQVQLVV